MTMRCYDTNLHFYLFCIRICILPDVLGLLAHFCLLHLFFAETSKAPPERTTRFFYKQHFYKQHQAEIGKNIKNVRKTLSNALRLNFHFLKIIHFLLSRCFAEKVQLF